VQNIELYRVLIEKYPETLIVEDTWGAVPLLYALWGDAPSEIIQFLVASYKSIHPNYELAWEEMLVTFSKAKVSNNAIQMLLDLRSEFVPNQMEQWIEELAENECISKETFHILIQYGFAERVKTIGLKLCRDEMMEFMMEEMKKYVPSSSKVVWLNRIRSKLVNYEEEYKRLKAATTILELAMWKYKMGESDNKKRKRTEESDSDFREQCRVSCSGDIVIEHVLPYLLPCAE